MSKEIGGTTSRYDGAKAGKDVNRSKVAEQFSGDKKCMDCHIVKK